MILLTGCAGVAENGAIQPLYEINVSRIEQDREDGRIVTAMQDLFLLRSRGEREGAGEQASEIAVLKEKLKEDLKQKFQTSLEKNEYETALRLSVSARQAGWEEVLDRDHLSLKRDHVMFELEKGNPVRALALARQIENFSIFEEEHLQRMLEGAIEEEKYTTAGMILEELGRRDVEPVHQLPENSADKYSQAQLIRGTVTIWVNRGMRIEDGVGLPDRVIGSGFYVDRRGYIITNYHVIRSQVDPKYEGYSRLYIRPSKKPEDKIPARVVGYDSAFDIALLKVEVSPETVLSFSPVKEQTAGDKIYAIGSPGGLENTVTSGIVSATDRRFLQMGNVVQVDVPINQGNSGGPLLDGNGNLIGVVFAGIEQFEGINFAIPVQWVMHIFPQLYNDGQISHPFLGVSLYKMDAGLEVTYVLPSSPADRIGIQAGDVLQELAGTAVDSIVSAHDTILQYRPETLVEIKWSRGSIQHQGRTVLSTRPEIPLKKVIDYGQPEQLFAPAFGMQVEKVRDNLLGTRYLVEKVYNGSVADETGISVNDPFSLQQWKYLEEQKVILAQIRIKKRKAGFLETGVQLGAYVETNDFL
ncbi:MAG: S1C family serine protease [Spirochaetaceae bacterium]|nr:S1C family serine protease [Spirochaetaceae bacterium]MCF7947979.1 S1C family serine protease [Spirochaetia bacterium]MCF7950870.1 S1C family serine protease [Spirochaetaceae bacterium]